MASYPWLLLQLRRAERELDDAAGEVDRIAHRWQLDPDDWRLAAQLDAAIEAEYEAIAAQAAAAECLHIRGWRCRR